MSPPSRNTPGQEYWEARAQRFAARGQGLAAVCSYGMPSFYNRYTDALQRRALAPWLAVSPGTSVLEVGCGVGRWTEQLARAGATVVGVDLSATMIAAARRRVAAANLSGACRFLIADVATLSLRRRFDLVIAVTVLQHVLDPAALRSAVRAIASHVNPAGRVVLLEAAPALATCRCDNTAFVTRDEQTYRRVFAETGLDLETVEAVDPAPFRTSVLPRYRQLPRPIAVAAMLLATLASAPIDFAPRRAVGASWHKVFVLTPAALHGGTRKAS